MRRPLSWILAGALGVAAVVGGALPVEPRPNVPFPTLGGKQVWSDEFVRAGWRIQTNVLTGHYRLLDPHDVRRAWGTFEQCRRALDSARPAEPADQGQRRLVLLVHGLGRSAGSLAPLAEPLRRDGWTPQAVSYASTRAGIEAHAERLARLIARLEGVGEISFVTHSMGGLVVRAALAHPEIRDANIRFGRLVMIAPPSRGSALAAALGDWAAFRWLTSRAGEDLAPTRARAIPVPSIPFGIIAGARGSETGFNPFLPGDDDGLVALAETRLPGAADFLVVPGPHGLVDQHPATICAVRAFLKHGRFAPPPC